MTVSECVKKFENCNSDIAKKSFMDSLKVRTYIPVKLKQTTIDYVLNKQLFKHDGNLITYKSIDKMVYFMMSIVGLYLDLDLGNATDDFDAMMSSGFFDALIEAIGVDVDVYRDMFDATLNDYMREHNSIVVLVNHKLEQIGSLASSVLEPLKSTFGEEFQTQLKESLKELEKLYSELA